MPGDSPIARLLTHGGDAIGPPVSKESCLTWLPPTGLPDTLTEELCDALLCRKNGFYAFDRALLVRPLCGTAPPLSVRAWNLPETWLFAYDLPLPELLCFASDLFGGQYALCEEGVCYFDAETGEVEVVARNVSDWADLILRECDVRTGRPLAVAWQAANGALHSGHRLIPRQLFVLGGEFSVSNMMSRDEIFVMRALGGYATAIKDVPDGNFVTFDFVEGDEVEGG